MRSTHTFILMAFLGLVLVSACSADDSSDLSGMPPSDEAIAANQQAQIVPAGYTDCGTVDLSSGWPTTTVYLSDQAGSCLAEAEQSGEPAQQSFSGRNDNGGIYGAIVRVNGPADMSTTSYEIDEAGNIVSEETRCSELDMTRIGPPTCPQTP